MLGPLSAALFGTAIALALVWKVGKDPNGHERVDAHKLVVGFSALAALVGFLVGIGLAIGGLFESRRARGPAIAGLALNALGALLVALLVIIGLMARR